MGSRAGTELPTSPLFRPLLFSTPTPLFPPSPTTTTKKLDRRCALVFQFFQFEKEQNSISIFEGKIISVASETNWWFSPVAVPLFFFPKCRLTSLRILSLSYYILYKPHRISPSTSYQKGKSYTVIAHRKTCGYFNR